MMKTLEQLGISPAPWRQDANGYGTLDVLGSDDSLVVAYENPINRNDQENRRLIAAAPKLYKSLREAIIEMCHMCPYCSCHPNYECTNPKTGCFVKKWRDVLDESAGESEVHQ